MVGVIFLEDVGSLDCMLDDGVEADAVVVVVADEEEMVVVVVVVVVGRADPDDGDFLPVFNAPSRAFLSASRFIFFSSASCSTLNLACSPFRIRFSAASLNLRSISARFFAFADSVSARSCADFMPPALSRVGLLELLLMLLDGVDSVADMESQSPWSPRKDLAAPPPPPPLFSGKNETPPPENSNVFFCSAFRLFCSAVAVALAAARRAVDGDPCESCDPLEPFLPLPAGDGLGR